MLALLFSRRDYFMSVKARVLNYAIRHDVAERQIAIETFHAKILLADYVRAYIGSSNMTRDISMDCGVVLSGPCVKPVAALVDAILAISPALGFDSWSVI